MKVGDLVMHKRKKYQHQIDHRREWGVGYVIEVHHSKYENHIPFVTVVWPKWNTETKGSQAYLEVLNNENYSKNN